MSVVWAGAWFAAPSASAQPVAVTEAPALEWGFKLSWRQYAGVPDLSGGATQVAESSIAGYDVGWAFDSGSYDGDTRTTVLRYKGSARWHSHPNSGFPPPPGYTGPTDIDLLDLTLTDPVVTISADRATISAEAHSRDLNSWEIVDYGRIDVADLAADAATPTVAGGTTTWSGIPATMNAQASPVFGGTYYPTGVAVDVVGFSYAGPGGAPDFSEHFDAPGRIKLALSGDNVLLAPATTQTGSYETFAVDQGRRLAHTRLYSSDDDSYTYRAFDLDTMAVVGEPFVLPWASFDTVLLNDTSSGRIYGASDTDAHPRTWIRYDADQGEYVQGEDAEAIATNQDYSNLSWDPVGVRAFEVVLSLPDGVEFDDYDARQWQLRTYTRQPDGTWQTRIYDLPNGSAHLNASRYRRLGVAAADGSLILLGDAWTSRPEGAVEVPATVPGAYRVVTHEDGTADVAAIPGSDVSNEIDAVFTNALAAADGTVGLVGRGGDGTVQRFDVTPPSGESIAAEKAVALGFPANDIPAEDATIDPRDGTVWVGGLKSKRIVGVRDGRIVADQKFALRNTRSGTLIAGPDHSLVMQSNDGSEASLTETAYGFQKLALVGVTATVDTDPADQSVTLLAGEDSEQVSFSAAATADPAPTIQWQSKAPGSTRFADLDGETAATLTVDARRGMGGTQYRAVFENPAGEVASEPATLTVTYAAAVAFEPLDATATVGTDATFQLLAVGVPEPAIAWERQVAGHWEGIDPDSGDFDSDGNTLTVKDVDLGMDGSLFRARVSNGIATVFTRAARLSVKAAADQSVTFGSGTVDWGFANRWRCYVTGQIAHGEIDISGGIERIPGTGATGSLCTGGALGSEALRFPVLGGRYDPATGALEVNLGGTVRFWGHVMGGVPALDTTFSSLRIVSDGTTATLYADTVGATMENPVPVKRVGVALVSVDLAGNQPVPTGSGLGWNTLATALTADGAQVFGGYPAGEPFDPLTLNLVYGTPQDPDPEPQPQHEPNRESPPKPQPEPQPKGQPAKIAVSKKARTVGSNRVVALATLICPAGNACKVTAPKRVAIKIAGARYRLTVLAPKTIRPGRRATLRARLSKAAAHRLAGRKTTVELKVTLGTTTSTIRVTLQGKARRPSTPVR